MYQYQFIKCVKYTIFMWEVIETEWEVYKNSLFCVHGLFFVFYKSKSCA